MVWPLKFRAYRKIRKTWVEWDGCGLRKSNENSWKLSARV